MKLSFDGFIKNINNNMQVNNDKANLGEKTISNAGKNFDKITLTSSSRDIEEKIFTEELAKKLKCEIKQEEDRERKIQMLKEKIENKTYIADSRKIAAGMLYQTGDKNE